MKRPLFFLIALALVCGAASPGCVRVKVDPIEINLNVKLQKAGEDLDSFFSDIDAASTTR